MATMPGELMTRHRLTVDDYHQMAESGILGPDDRVELIAGEVLDMSPIGALHAAIVRTLARWLTDSAGPRAIVAVQDPIHLDDSSEPQPDIALLKPRPDYYAAAHPGSADTLLIVEVAESSLAYDLGVKVPLYARHGIPEVWVIDAATRNTHRFRGPRPEGYAEQVMIAPEEPLTCLALPGATTTLATALPLGRPDAQQDH
jgi:Uma2 family endonuclease